MMNSLHLYFAVVFAASILVNAEYNGTNDFNSTFEWSESQLLKIYPEGSPLVVRSFEPYVLVCKGKAEEDFTNMEWRNPNGTVIQEENSAQRGGVRKLDNSTLKLRFPSPQVEDSGEYICSATYQYTETVNASVHLHIYENIQFEECSEQQSLLLGTDGEVRCRVVGSPAPEVIWSKDDKIITSDSKYIVSADKLLIPNVTDVDQGTYVVEAFARSTGQFEHRSIKVAVKKPETTCPPDRFRCLNGECIRYWYVCNGFNDCGDWSDEINCTSTTAHPPCSFDQFQCDNGRCINVSDVCDGYNDCGDWSDERNCTTQSYRTTRSTCSYWQFRCDNGLCINQNYVCDGDNDCGDWSDERGCSSTRNGWTTPSYCTSREFRCANGRCINKMYVCDGDNDCGDWSDELDCTPSPGPRCSFGMFTCRNGRCIRGRYVCDGDNDCGDWSDESDCPSTYSYSSITTPKLGIIIGIVVGLSVLIIVFVIVIWIVKTRKSKTQPGNVVSSQPPTESHTVQQLPERRFQASHGPQPTTQSSGDLDHAPVQRFHQSATSESAIHHPAALYQTHAHGLRQPATSPSVIEEQGNLHTGVVHDMHLAPHSQIPQSNLYPALPQQTYPTAPESSSS